MENTKKIIDEAVDEAVFFLKLYIKTRMEQICKKIEIIETVHNNIGKEIEKSTNTILDKRGYSEYIKYIVSSDFENKEKQFINKVEQLILDKMSNKKDNSLYIYIAIMILFALQIALFIVK
jgi:hypothetical protein